MSIHGEERKQAILTMLAGSGKVQTNELVEKFKVSSESIRRYLEELEREKKLKRVYGGAVSIEVDGIEQPHLQREVTRAQEKALIGRKAAELINDGDKIFIDEGTTPIQVVKHIPYKKDIVVVTPSIPVLTMLIDYQNKGRFPGELYFIGGKVNAEHSRIFGSIAEKMVEDFHVDKLFVSIDAISLENGISGHDVHKALLTKKLMSHTDKRIILADHTKIDKKAFRKIAGIDEIDVVVSDVKAPYEWLDSLKEKEIDWM